MAEGSWLEGRGCGHALQIEGAFAAPVLLGAGCQRLNKVKIIMSWFSLDDLTLVLEKVPSEGS